MAIKLIAFDWNGTLLSDTEICRRAENVALSAVGVKPITLTKFKQTFNVPIIKYWRAIGLTDDFLDQHLITIEERFHVEYEKIVNNSRTRSGAREVLNWLQNQDIKAIIYSNHNIPNIHRLLIRLKIDCLIDKVLARKDSNDHTQVHSRAKEFYLQKFIKRLKFKPREVISVGDTEEEIEIGKKYGYHTVAITGGYNTTARLKKHHPDFLIHNMLELKKIVQKLNN